MVSTFKWRANHDGAIAGRELLAKIPQPFVRAEQVGCGARTRPHVLISAPRRNAFLRQIKKVFGEAPTTAREACARPRPLARRLRQLVGLRPKTSLNTYFPREMIPSPAGRRLG